MLLSLTLYVIIDNLSNTKRSRQPQKQENNKMADKALISELTWRSLEMQKAAFPDMPHYVAPDEINHLLRVTTRENFYRIHVMSLGVIADTEKDFREFLALAKQRKCEIVNHEDDQTFSVRGNCESLVKRWKEARKNGVAKIGGKISADLRKKQSLEAANKIKDRWPQPSKVWPTQVLLKEAGKSFNTIKSILGSRVIAQYNYQAKLKRKAKKEGKDG